MKTLFATQKVEETKSTQGKEVNLKARLLIVTSRAMYIIEQECYLTPPKQKGFFALLNPPSCVTYFFPGLTIF